MTNLFDDYPDLVAKWTVAFPQGLQTIEFEHGETTGKRVIRINGEEVGLFLHDNISMFLLSISRLCVKTGCSV